MREATKAVLVAGLLTMGMPAKMAAAATTAHHFAQAKLALSKKNNFGALVHAEKILCADPENSSGHRVIVDASKSLDYPQTLISSLQLLKRVNPKDNKLTQELADALEMLGDVLCFFVSLLPISRALKRLYHLRHKPLERKRYTLLCLWISGGDDSIDFLAMFP